MAENKGNQGGHSKERPENVPDYPLEQREYQDKDGETHHHTNVWMSRHSDEKPQGESNQGGGSNQSQRGGSQSRKGGQSKGGGRS